MHRPRTRPRIFFPMERQQCALGEGWGGGVPPDITSRRSRLELCAREWLSGSQCSSRAPCARCDRAPWPTYRAPRPTRRGLAGRLSRGRRRGQAEGPGDASRRHLLLHRRDTGRSRRRRRRKRRRRRGLMLGVGLPTSFLSPRSFVEGESEGDDQCEFLLPPGSWSRGTHTLIVKM
jgi:hypothetical protein